MYMIWDLETENHTTYKRFANPFDDKNWVVARGWKFQGDAAASYSYHPERDGKYTHIPENITMIVGHHLKFDLLYEWDNPELIAFFKRGGVIWDTQLAEYLLEAQHPDVHMVALDTIVESYGGRKKINSVKALWEMGMLTSQIDRDLLIDYLIGTEEEERNSGDIGNTELIFLGQVKKAKARRMAKMIMARMDSMLATTEMEYNGLKIDVTEGKRRTRILEADLERVDESLLQYIPELPPELVFNWASNVHVSSLIFGGTIKYEKAAPYLDENGEYVRKMDVEEWPTYGGTAYHPEDPHVAGLGPDTYTSGKRKGEIKTKKVKIPGELRLKKQVFLVELEGYTSPDAKWQGKQVDGSGSPIYSVGADIIEELGKRDIPFLKALAERQNIVKDLGTYYLRYDSKKKDYVGMLTAVMRETHIIHHNINHTSTVTTRTSSDKPNLQNIPTAGTSEVKKMFISRFINGKMMEADYSQLEIIGQAILCKDKNLCEDIRNKVDFHCKRVSVKHGISYEDALAWCKDENHPDFKNGKEERRKAKEFSFQRAYGAGAASIAESTGMSVDEVKDLIEAEEAMYPGVTEFNDVVEQAVKLSAVPFKDPFRGFKTYRRGYWQAPTGTMYTFRSYDAPAFLREKGIEDSFKPTEMKNYPVQGTSGEIVQIILGRLWRHFLSTDNYEGGALLCNTVHDSVWLDVKQELVDQVAHDVKTIMESVPEALFELYGMEVEVPFPVEIEVGDNLYTKHVVHTN